LERKKQMKRFGGLLLSVAGLVLLMGSASVQAGTVIGTEDDANGLVAPLPGAFPAIWLASDGESAFRPFGSANDLSDAIQFNDVWVGDMPVGTNWVQAVGVDQTSGLPNVNTWFLPAINENEPAGEDVGRWVLPGAFWDPTSLGVYTMLESGGGDGDKFILANDGPAGSASLTFISDPFAVPVPASVWGGSLLLAGLLVARRRVARVAA
jgi:hypothetical protein